MYFPSLLLQTTLSFCRMPSLSFSHKCQFSVRSVHAATWSLLNRLCKSFHNCQVLELKHFKQKLPEESHVLPLLSKALAQFKKKKPLGYHHRTCKIPRITAIKGFIHTTETEFIHTTECQIAMCSTNILLTFCSF